jgi:hypothetical protein
MSFKQKPYPELNKAITIQLSDLREAGVAVNLLSATAIIRTNVREMAPKLFTENNLVLSSSFVHRYLQTEMNWSFRAATKAAKKLPDEWRTLCKEAILRISTTMRTFRVPPALVINGDQTGVNLFPCDNKTYEIKGSKQVAVLGQDDKRHITLMVTSAMDGTLLPFQAVMKGKTKDSLPSVQARQSAEGMGMRFVTGGDKHWATLDTTKDVSTVYQCIRRLDTKRARVAHH